MKTKASFLSVCITLLFIQCSSTQFVKNPEFNITSATYHSWVGGQPGTGGINIKIDVENATEVNFGAVYFRGKQTKLNRNKKNDTIFLLGHFPKKSNKNGLVLDKNTVKELQNKPPVDENTFPFQLEKNEIVISYSYKEKIKYFKTKVVKQKTKQFQ
jgi:hypothetical protein